MPAQNYSDIFLGTFTTIETFLLAINERIEGLLLVEEGSAVVEILREAGGVVWIPRLKNSQVN